MCLNTSSASNTAENNSNENNPESSSSSSPRSSGAEVQDNNRNQVDHQRKNRLESLSSVLAMEAAAAAAAAAANKLNSSSSVDYTPRSSPPSSLNRSPPPSARSASPPTLVPSAMSMVSMASMLGAHHPPFGLPVGYPGMPGSRDDFAASMHKFMDRSFGDSPPPSVPTNDPTANECKVVDYRGEKVAAFMIMGKTMLCLPQAFELFLKHLVGGLHTVYTKLKRLEITPIVCNVEQVRILRGLGAIQPGVNRCKLLADSDFDQLYKDCTTSRCSKPIVGISKSLPGRPPKRGVPFPPMSPQDAMLHLKQSMHHNGSNAPSGGAGEHYKEGPYPKEPRLGNGFGGPPGAPHGLNPMAAQFMALNHPAAAAQAAFLQAGGGLGPFGLPGAAGATGIPTSSPGGIPGGPGAAAAAASRAAADLMKSPGMASLEALQRSGLFGAAYLERMREGQARLADQERQQQQQQQQQQAAQADAMDRNSGNTGSEHQQRERRDSSSNADSLSQGRGGGDRGESPILNLTKIHGGGGFHQNNGDLRRQSTDELKEKHLAAAAEAAAERKQQMRPRSESPLSPGGIMRTDDEDDIVAEKVTKKADKANNNGSNGGTQQAPPQNPFGGLGGAFPANLAAAAAAAGMPGAATDGEGGQLNNVVNIIGNIQSLLKMAVDNAKQEERAANKPVSTGTDVDELKRHTQLYLRRFKKEKRFRRRLQERLEQETKKRLAVMEALKLADADTYKRIAELQNNSVDTAMTSDVEDDLDDEEEADSSSGKDEVASGGADASARDPADGEDMDEGDRRIGDTSSSKLTAKVTATSEEEAQQQQQAANSSGASGPRSSSGDESSPARDAAPTIGFAKNLFPFNGSSLFTSATN